MGASYQLPTQLPHLRYSLLRDVKQNRLVVIDISGQSITFFHALLAPFFIIVYKVVMDPVVQSV